jgi:hypothetical protein
VVKGLDRFIGVANYRLRLRVTKRCDSSHVAIGGGAEVTYGETGGLRVVGCVFDIEARGYDLDS